MVDALEAARTRARRAELVAVALVVVVVACVVVIVAAHR